MSDVDPWVWARDRVTGHAFPLTRAAAEQFADRYEPVPDHPVRDDLGRLLPTEFATQPPKPAPKKKES